MSFFVYPDAGDEAAPNGDPSATPSSNPAAKKGKGFYFHDVFQNLFALARMATT